MQGLVHKQHLHQPHRQAPFLRSYFRCFILKSSLQVQHCFLLDKQPSHINDLIEEDAHWEADEEDATSASCGNPCAGTLLAVMELCWPVEVVPLKSIGSRESTPHSGLEFFFVCVCAVYLLISFFIAGASVSPACITFWQDEYPNASRTCEDHRECVVDIAQHLCKSSKIK